MYTLNIKLRNYEKATKFEKNLTRALTQQVFLLSSVTTSSTFFQIFSEKLNFTDNFQILTTSLIDFQLRTSPLAVMFLVFIESHPS